MFFKVYSYLFVEDGTLMMNKLVKIDNVCIQPDFIRLIRGISYDFDQKNYMFWKLVNSFKMMK